jgi:hypothetical protein
MSWQPSSGFLQAIGRVDETFGSETSQALVAWALNQPSEPSTDGIANYIGLLSTQSVGGLRL